jgi:hypothetical protein
MHPRLYQMLEKAERHFRADPRCLGLYLFGSVGKGTDDPHSDLDLGIIAGDAEYAAVKAEFRSLCEELCGPMVAWMAEGEREEFVNYAFLFEADGELLLADFSLMSQSFVTRSGERPVRILYDPEGLLASLQEPPARSFTPERLLATITEYWVYAYINGKYWKRADALKLRYLQEVLFRLHVRLLPALYPSVDGSWWPLTLRALPPARQERMRAYFGPAEPATIAARLGGELDLFSEDAREACRVRQIEYPDATERRVRAHLRRMGLPIDG